MEPKEITNGTKINKKIDSKEIKNGTKINKKWT
jgi:hypothetical protein